MLYINVWLTAKDPSQAPQVLQLLTRHAALSRAEPGCARFEVYQSEKDAARFLLVERWESQAAIDEHRKAEGYTTIYLPQVLPLVERDPHPCRLVG